MTSSVAMLPDWSDDDDDDRRELQPPPSPQSRTALLENVEEYKAILRSIDHQETTDLRHSLANRAHLERLVDRYWEHCLKERPAQASLNADDDENAVERSQSEEARLNDEVKNKLKGMILHHPSFRVSPLLLRWPLLAADVPKPMWTLSDEILAVLEKQRRASSSEEVQDNFADPIDIDIAMPAMVSCQHALVGILHDLAIKSEAHRTNSSSTTSKRDSTFDWKDILSTLAKRSDVPESVFKATQDRLEGIYGRAQKVPPNFWMSNMGIGGTDVILETMKRKDGIPPKHQTVVRPTTDFARQRHKVMRSLDEELLLAPSSKKARYLEQAPVRGALKRSRLKP
jgi:hypothetical protein